ncbi:MAG TPA: response regulator [Anaerolineae bacterium]|nr:response regulator [Anaerolineae bacterium]
MMARILVIDDNADLLQMIRLLLEDQGGHEVILSAEGEDGLARALDNPPDLAIVDVMMPGITGYEVCRRLRQEPSTADTPIIILTARGQPVDRQMALEAGADEYIAKPVTMTVLLERVNRLLAQRAVRPAAPTPGMIALVSLRGGVGVTTLAVNLAVIYARQSPDQVCLVDLSTSSGHAALQLGLRPDPNWSALALLDADPGEVAVRNYLLAHPAGLHLLAAPFVPVIGEGPTGEMVLSTLTLLRQGFNTVVVDLPSVLLEGTMAVLEAADAIGVVTTADPPAIQTTVGTLQVLRSFIPKVRLILNQVAPGTPVSVEALQRVLKQPLVASIPFDAGQAEALAHGKPLALTTPQSPLAQGAARVAAALVGASVRPSAT